MANKQNFASSGGRHLNSPEATRTLGGKRPSFVDKVLDELLDEFDYGIIKPGQRINAAGLSEKLGISRGPVREALAFLAGRGLIDLERDRGAALRPMSTKNVIQIWEIFRPLIGESLKLAADHIHEGDNAGRVREAMSAIHAAARTDKTFRFYFTLNTFHFLMFSISGNPYFAETTTNMNVSYWNRYLADHIDISSTADQYIENYRRQADGVLAGDGEAAAAAWRFHVNWSIEMIRQATQDP